MRIMKKILFVSHIANFSKFNINFMRWFRQQGWGVYYASDGKEPVQECDHSYTIPFMRSPVSPKNITAYRQLKAIIMREKFDIIHCHTPVGGVVARLAARKARNQGTSVIYTGHGLHFYKGAPLLNWILYYPVEKFCARYTDCMITINQEDYQNVRRFKFKAGEIHHVHGIGVSLERFHLHTQADKRSLRKEYGYSVQDYIMIVVAELNKNKNQEFLIKALDTMKIRFPQLKLLIVGTGEHEAVLSDLIKERNLTDRITLLGYRNDVDKLLALSDVLVTASYREGLPVNIIEAMASGLPVICTDVRGQRDLVKNGRNGFLYPVNDEKKFCNAIEYLIFEKDTVAEMCANNVQDVQLYSAQHVVKEMADIYRKYM